MKRREFLKTIPAMALLPTLIDGTATGQTGQFYPIDAGFSII